MGKKYKKSPHNQQGEISELIIKGADYRKEFKGKAKNNSIRDLYFLLSAWEKHLPYTINQIINLDHGWV